ncbi:MAG TPA: fumarylacetoacetate hydrolase family protein [Ilumatobacter sp.]
MIGRVDRGDGAELGLLADELWTARSERRLLDVDDVIGRRGRDWSMGDAYLVQEMLMQRRRDRGERHVGWKLGYTSLAMREQMGIREPNFGPLTDAMLVGNGDSVPPTVMQPRVEPEIAVRLAVDLSPVPSLAEIAESVETASACLEVVDSVWAGYRFRIEHNTADASSAAYVVLGGAIAADDLSTVRVRFRHNGDDVAVATGAAASGDPLVGIAWLARQLASTGRRLRAGEIIITGGLTAAVPLDEGDCVEAIFDGDVLVSCRR